MRCDSALTETLLKELPHDHTHPLSQGLDRRRGSRQHDSDCRRISNYLTKQTTPEHLSLDPFRSDLTPTCNCPRDATDLQQTLQHLKATQHLNLSAFCRAAIAEKLQRHLQQEIK